MEREIWRSGDLGSVRVEMGDRVGLEGRVRRSVPADMRTGVGMAEIHQCFAGGVMHDEVGRVIQEEGIGRIGWEG